MYNIVNFLIKDLVGFFTKIPLLSRLDSKRPSTALACREEVCRCGYAIPRFCGDGNASCLYPYFGGSKTFLRGSTEINPGRPSTFNPGGDIG